MRRKHHIPSVEEIKARMELQSAGVAVGAITPAIHSAALTERDALKNKVQDLQDQLARAKVSPTTMKLTFDVLCEKYQVEPAEELKTGFK